MCVLLHTASGISSVLMQLDIYINVSVDHSLMKAGMFLYCF